MASFICVTVRWTGQNPLRPGWGKNENWNSVQGESNAGEKVPDCCTSSETSGSEHREQEQAPRAGQSTSPVLMERRELPPSRLQIMGSSLFPVRSHTDSSHGTAFRGTQTVTETLCVTFFSIFVPRSKVMVIPDGASLPQTCWSCGILPHHYLPPRPAP